MSQSRSPQEIRIQNEINHKKIANVHANRATEILKKVRESKPQIDIERGLYFTKSFQKTEGQPLILRWAKALKYYAENASIYIDENQLEIDIEADGGINLRTMDSVKKAGANILVAGTAILIAKDYGEIIKELAK